jgi:hypothetical protein
MESPHTSHMYNKSLSSLKGVSLIATIQMLSSGGSLVKYIATCTKVVMKKKSFKKKQL